MSSDRPISPVPALPLTPDERDAALTPDERDAALAPDERDAALAPLAGFASIVLAVSGGPDSMALLDLVARWKAARGPDLPPVEVVTVDHRLRPGSAAEARFVGVEAKRLGLRHTTLSWPDGNAAAGGLQDKARTARYRLLAQHAAAAGPSPRAVVTAHTEDDQAETLLMRLGRGSGLDGLSAMPGLRLLDDSANVWLVRPLIGVSKARLIATLVSAGRAYQDDPSNANERFERVRLRAAGPALAELGLVNERIALSARRLARARTALDHVARQAMADWVDCCDGLFAIIDRAAFARAPEDIQVRVMASVLSQFGGSAPAAQLSEVERLVGRLVRQPREASTLGGTLVSAGPAAIRIVRDWGRAPLPSLHLAPGETALWDQRFQVSLDDTADTRRLCGEGPVTVRPFGASALSTLTGLGLDRPLPDGRAAEGPARRGAIWNSRAPARAYATLPAFWHGEWLLAVPTLGSHSARLAGLGPDGHGLCSGACRARFDGLRRATLVDFYA